MPLAWAARLLKVQTQCDGRKSKSTSNFLLFSSRFNYSMTLKLGPGLDGLKTFFELKSWEKIWIKLNAATLYSMFRKRKYALISEECSILPTYCLDIKWNVACNDFRIFLVAKCWCTWAETWRNIWHGHSVVQPSYCKYTFPIYLSSSSLQSKLQSGRQWIKSYWPIFKNQSISPALSTS